MSDQVTERPLVQLVGDQNAAYCDPESGVCELPATSRAAESDELPETADAR